MSARERSPLRHVDSSDQNTRHHEHDSRSHRKHDRSSARRERREHERRDSRDFDYRDSRDNRDYDRRDRRDRDRYEQREGERYDHRRNDSGRSRDQHERRHDQPRDSSPRRDRRRNDIDSQSQRSSDQTNRFPASKHSHFTLVPGHCNTTNKDPLPRPPDMRLVTALASKGKTLAQSLHNMNSGPSGHSMFLQHLTTRDVVMIPDLFSPEAGFVMPPDPFDSGNGKPKTIYERLVEEIHQAGSAAPARDSGKGKGKGKGGKGDTRPEGDDANGLFKAWHKTNAKAAGDGLADANGYHGNGHLIVNDRDERWGAAQRRGEAPMYDAIHARIEEFFGMKIHGKRYNHYRDMTNWKPFHHDAAGLDKDAGKGKGKGKGGGRPPMSETQNMTVGVSFGEARQAAFEWAGAREAHDFPRHLQSPPVNPGQNQNVVLSLTLPDCSTYTFGRDLNLLWKHGILAEKTPTGKTGCGHIDVEEGRISIIAWGWVDQHDELDQYL